MIVVLAHQRIALAASNVMRLPMQHESCCLLGRALGQPGSSNLPETRGASHKPTCADEDGEAAKRGKGGGKDKAKGGRAAKASETKEEARKIQEVRRARDARQA